MELADLPVPPAGSKGIQIRRLSPRAILGQYNSEEWETFIREWVSLLGYDRVVRPTGSGDRGIDVAGLTSNDGTDGVWDCYQCKHYKDALTPTDAIPEIFKMVRGHIEGAFTLPRRYYFLAPKGCGTALTLLLASPAKLKTRLIEDIAKNPKWLRDVPSATIQEVLTAAVVLDFGIFREMPLEDVLATHIKSPYFLSRFQVELPPRPDNELPPNTIHEQIESRYIEQLLDTYAERFSIPSPSSVDSVRQHDQADAHLKRQRLAFWSAQTLQRFARDQVPDGTFESLQNEVHSAVIEIADSEHRSAFVRMTSVLTAATQIALDSNPLMPRVHIDDRKGICHQLANEDRLIWRQE